MAELPQVIPKASNPQIASYDYIDLATGLGIQTYYGIRTKSRNDEDNVTYVNQLSSTADIWPTDVKISQTAVATTTYNFDTSEFNLPRTARGTATFNAVLTNEEADNQECVVTVQLYKVHVDNVTTTALTSAIQWRRTDQSGGAPDSSLSPNEEENMLIFLPITQNTIKKGEKLRLAVSLQMISGAGTDTMNVYCDPQERSILTNPDISSQMKLLMSFRVDY